jgi:epoxyqueuosine reductase
VTQTSADPSELAERVKALALALGFDRAGIARLEPTRESEAFRSWLARGHHGEMSWLARKIEERVDPRKVMEGARSALVVGLVYDQAPSSPRQADRLDHPASAREAGARSEPKASEVNRFAAAQQPNRPEADSRSEPKASEVNRFAAAQQPNRPEADSRSEPTASPPRQSDRLEHRPAPAKQARAASAASEVNSYGRIARYAGGDDYHDVMRERLRAVGDALEPLAGRAVRWRAYVDTGPLLERVLAAQAGLGWIGKNTCLIDPELGSYLFLGVLLCDLELLAGAREPDHCGSCRACLDACPSAAFPVPYELDATRCLSYTTIELRDAIPESLRAGQGDWVFGCDVCQEVCPWNTRARREVPADRGGLRSRLAARPEWRAPPLAWLLELDEAAWRSATRQTALRRAKWRGMLRNALVAAGNSGDGSLRPHLERHASGADPLLAEHARWALGQLAEPSEETPELRGLPGRHSRRG